MNGFYLRCLTNEFSKRKNRNPSYSIRAFARFLEIDHSVLASVFRGKRRIPKKCARKVTQKLDLSPRQSQEFLLSLANMRASLVQLSKVPLRTEAHEEKVLSEDDCFHIIADPEHYSILSLCEMEGFSSEPAWIAKRLGVTETQVRVAINRLITAGLLKKNGNQLIPAQGAVTTTQDVSSCALRASHKVTLKLAEEAIEQTSVDLRYFGTMTMAINLQRLNEAKELIREFQRKLSAFLEVSPKSEVYQLAIQLFPLTKPERK